MYDYSKTYTFSNNLRGFYAKNINGRYDDLIVSTIKNFCEKDTDELIRICEEDEYIAEICSLSIPALEAYWLEKLQQISNKRNNSDALFDQFVDSYLNLGSSFNPLVKL